MLLDEADAIFGPRSGERYEGLRAILNSGNRQGTPVLRVKLEGRRREVDEFDVFGPKAVAGIGKLPDTVANRSIPIRMKRRAPSEQVARFRRRSAQAEAAQIGQPSVAVADVAVVAVPPELPDRAADGWETLLAIADAAGAGWPMRARLAAVALSAEHEVELSIGVRLLSDVRDAFGERDHLATADLLTFLHELDEAPWGEWYGKPLTARGLAKLLEPFGAYRRHCHRGEKTRARHCQRPDLEGSSVSLRSDRRGVGCHVGLSPAPSPAWPMLGTHATTYEFTSEIRAGLTVNYALLRWTTPDLRHSDDQPEEHLHGSWVVREGRQVISLGYVYPGGTPSQPGAGPVLPDTALPSPSGQ